MIEKPKDVSRDFGWSIVSGLFGFIVLHSLLSFLRITDWGNYTYFESMCTNEPASEFYKLSDSLILLLASIICGADSFNALFLAKNEIYFQSVVDRSYEFLLKSSIVYVLLISTYQFVIYGILSADPWLAPHVAGAFIFSWAGLYLSFLVLAVTLALPIAAFAIAFFFMAINLLYLVWDRFLEFYRQTA